MAQLSIFGYGRRTTVLHLVDARIKLASLAAVSLAALHAGPAGLAAGIATAAMVLVKAQVSLTRFVRETRWFLLLLVIVIISRALTTQGQAPEGEGLWIVTARGVIDGLEIAGRLLLMAMLGLSLTATTRPADIRGAMEWFLRPVPAVAHQKVSTMMGLLVRFIPVILTLSASISEAQAARGLGNRKNPLRRIRSHCMPLLRITFVTADRLAMAMEARCYSESHSPRVWQVTARDWKALSMATALCGLLLIY